MLCIWNSIKYLFNKDVCLLDYKKNNFRNDKKKICAQLFCFYNLCIYSYLFQMSSIFLTILILLTLQSNVHILINDSIDKRKLPVLKHSLNPKLSTELNCTCHNYHLGRQFNFSTAKTLNAIQPSKKQEQTRRICKLVEN